MVLQLFDERRTSQQLCSLFAERIGRRQTLRTSQALHEKNAE